MKSWTAVFAALVGVLVFRNRFLFGTPIYELGDTGANSIIIDQAKHFDLLVGNYSRQGFSHPGPAYFYLEAFGEWFFHDLLGIVPTPWNGQVLALYLLNAALFATVVLIVQRWTGSWFIAGTALLAMIVVLTQQPQIINNAWMPFVYVPSFLLLLFASASVAAGRDRDLWAIALSGGLLVHGHAVFLLFVPALAGIAVLLSIMRNRRRVDRVPFDRRSWTIALAILAVFLTPIVLNTIWHWPGEFGKYFGYGSSENAGSRSLGRSIAYVYWYWWPFKTLPLALFGIPIAAALIFFATRVRDPFVRAGLWLSLVVTLLLGYYAFAGIDNPNDPYMGFFYWSVPLFTVVALVIGLRHRLPAWHPAIPIALAVAVMLLVPGFRTITNDNEPSVPATLAAFRNLAGDRPVVLEITNNDIGPEVPGLLNWARREGMRACVRDPAWAFITTPGMICTADEIARGEVVSRWKVLPGSPAVPGEFARSGHSAFVRGSDTYLG